MKEERKMIGRPSFRMVFLFPVPSEAQRLKKRVSWAEDTNLVSVHYFDLDESERGKYVYIHQQVTSTVYMLS